MYSVIGEDKNLMNRSFPVHQTQAKAQLTSNKIVANIRYTQTSNSEKLTRSTEDNQDSIVKEANNKSDTPSHVRQFNISKKQLDLMEEQRLENHSSMSEDDSTTYEYETTITYILFPIHLVHIVDSM